MNPIRNAAVAAMMFLAPTVCFAQASGMGGGGTVTTDENGQLVVRDVGDPNVWRSYSGKRFLSTYGKRSALYPIMSALAKMNPYMAVKIMQKLESKRWVLTRNLKLLNVNDVDSVNKYEKLDQQAGIHSWTDGNIYLDLNVIEKLSPEQAALLYIHESLHAFLPREMSQYNNKLRSLVNAISLVYKGQINEEDLNDTLVVSGVWGIFLRADEAKLFHKVILTAKYNSTTLNELKKLVNKKLPSAVRDELGYSFGIFNFTDKTPTLNRIVEKGPVINRGDYRYADSRWVDFGTVGSCAIRFRTNVRYEDEKDYSFALLTITNLRQMIQIYDWNTPDAKIRAFMHRGGCNRKTTQFYDYLKTINELTKE